MATASFLLMSATALLLPLSDEVFLADADVRMERLDLDDRAVLRAACVVRDAETPAYRLTYGMSSGAEGEEEAATQVVCVWRPWRVGTFMVDDETCECDST